MTISYFLAFFSAAMVSFSAIQAMGEYPMTPEPPLESCPETTMEHLLNEFGRKGGTFHAVRPWDLKNSETKSIVFYPNDSVYPICTAGFCRSQTLWALLKPYEEKIVLFPPHATRFGLDPYNGEVNWHRNKHPEDQYPDEFNLVFSFPKATRFGYAEFGQYLPLKSEEISGSVLQEIGQFYSTYFFGPESHWQGKQGSRRVYLAFAQNAHAILHRLNQSNTDLSQVWLYFIDTPDYITSPKPEWNLVPRTQETYERFVDLLTPILDFSHLRG